MMFAIFLLSFVVLTSSEKNVTMFPNHWLEVPLDHFNLFDNRTWQMRYLVNDQYFEKGGPLFIEIGGEWTISSRSASIPQIRRLAEKHKGLYVATEHRFYGESLPFSSPKSQFFRFHVPSTRKLKYLKIEQTLEDLAYFIDHLKSTTEGLENSTVVVHGCSYGGIVATWIRLKYPHLVDISYASSAPLDFSLDYPGYYEVVNDVYANISINCIETIRKGFDMTQKLLRTFDGRWFVKDALRGWNCSNIDHMTSGEIIGKMVMVLGVQNDPYHFEEVSCLVLSMDTDDMSAFDRLASLVVLKSKASGCGSFKKTPEGLRHQIHWVYQMCTELGGFQTLSSQNPRHPFGLDWSLEEKVEMCSELFKGVTAETIKRGLDRMLRRYGGRNAKITKLVTVHGTHDPWMRRGMLQESGPEAPVVMLDGTHCDDVHERPNDPDELKNGRERIRNIISQWINEISHIN